MKIKKKNHFTPPSCQLLCQISAHCSSTGSSCSVSHRRPFVHSAFLVNVHCHESLGWRGTKPNRKVTDKIHGQNLLWRQMQSSPLIKGTSLCNRQKPLQKTTADHNAELESPAPMTHLQHPRLREHCRRGVGRPWELEEQRACRETVAPRNTRSYTYKASPT